MTRKVLLTGADGFIGSHCLEHLLSNTDWEIKCIASWRHDGVPERISDSEHFKRNSGRVEFFTHDLNAPLSDVLVQRLGDVSDIINFASDSNVDRSISEPASVILNNTNVVVNMLEFARRLPSLKTFIQISTDEVYGPAPESHNHKEWEMILPSNPYSASKAAQEAIAISYWRTYGVPLIITNTMNNIGERQSADKFLPKIIRSVVNGDSVSVHAVDKVIGSRYYLHARNHADACMFLINKSAAVSYPAPGRQGPFSDVPARYNVVGDVELSNLQLAEHVAEILQMRLRYELIDAHSQRPGHDLRYALDGAKIKEAGWSAPVSFQESLQRTVRWYIDNPEWLVV